jgi:tetratricopeptide (TPR) repeat protein
VTGDVRVAGGSVDSLERDATQVRTLQQLAGLLRVLRRRYARSRRDGELTYRDLAVRTGWSHASIAEYFTAKTLPPTRRLDELLVLLGADPAEQRALATARDRIDENRRGPAPARPATHGGQPGGAVTPRQLPPAARHFGGRRRELAALAALAGGASTAGTVLITVIAGTAGIGKTALAVHWAHQVAERFVDGQLYVNLRGFDPCGSPTDPADAIRRFLSALDVPPARVPADPEAQVALYRSLLADKRMLIVLDNARDAAQVRPLLPAGPGCLVVITSRDRLSSLVAAEGAYPVALDLLAELTWAALVVEHRGGRYTCHDLLRAYSARLAGTTDSEQDRRAATGRVVDHYVHTAHAAGRLLDPASEDALAAGVAGESFIEYRQALDSFTAEHAVLLGVVDRAAATGRHTRVGELARAMAVFLDRQGHWHDGIAVWQAAIVSAARLGDDAAQARGSRELARAYTRLCRFDDARVHLDRAVELATRAGDRLEQAHTHHMLAIMCERQGELGQALRHSLESLARYRDAGDRRGQAKATNAVGWHLSWPARHRGTPGVVVFR